MGRMINITGKKFGRLTVLKMSDKRNVSNDVLWECRCDCGGTKLTTSGNLRNGDAKSCGCIKFIDYPSFIGKTYGRLTVIRFMNNNKQVEVNCLCGNTVIKTWDYIRSGQTKSCGCIRKEDKTTVDLVTLKFGLLTVIKKLSVRNRFKEVLWECVCECGTYKNCTTAALQNGGNTSCGCRVGGRTHGDSGKRIRNIWNAMMSRCNNIKNPQYKTYGGRGIKVCKKWHDYQSFKTWAYSNGYSDILTIDRKNNNKGYSPANCRWATYKEQANNTRSNRYIEIKGIKKTIAQWSVISGIGQGRIARRLRLGWKSEEAVYKPIDSSRISKNNRKDVN